MTEISKEHVRLVKVGFEEDCGEDYCNPTYVEAMERLISIADRLASGEWVMVPREPTEAMQHAACMIAPTWDFETNAKKYRAMLSQAESATQSATSKAAESAPSD